MATVSDELKTQGQQCGATLYQQYSRTRGSVAQRVVKT